MEKVLNASTTTEMNVIFLTLSRIKDINDSGIYTDLMRKFKDEGHNVYIVCPYERKYGLKTSMTVQDGVHILGVRTLNIQKTRFLEKGIGTLLLAKKFNNAINKFYKNTKFDLILYSTPPLNIAYTVEKLKKSNPNAITYLLLKDIHPQSYLDLEIMSPSNPLYKFLRNLECKLYNISDFIGCMSPENKKYILRENPNIDTTKVGIAPNSIDPESLNTPIQFYNRQKYNISNDAIVFAYGGNIGMAQGVDFIISCMNYYKNNEHIYFIIVGSGTEFHKLEKWKNENKDSNNIRIKSMLPKEEYENLLNICDIGLIILDHRFTFPNYPSRLLSYLSKKMPILAATDSVCDVGKIAEENGYGFWCESDDLSGFVKCVDKYKNMTKEEINLMGEKGYKFLLDNYLVKNTYNSIISSFLKTK